MYSIILIVCFILREAATGKVPKRADTRLLASWWPSVVTRLFRAWSTLNKQGWGAGPGHVECALTDYYLVGGVCGWTRIRSLDGPQENPHSALFWEPEPLFRGNAFLFSQTFFQPVPVLKHIRFLEREPVLEHVFTLQHVPVFKLLLF